MYSQTVHLQTNHYPELQKSNLQIGGNLRCYLEDNITITYNNDRKQMDQQLGCLLPLLPYTSCLVPTYHPSLLHVQLHYHTHNIYSNHQYSASFGIDPKGWLEVQSYSESAKKSCVIREGIPTQIAYLLPIRLLDDYIISVAYIKTLPVVFFTCYPIML